MNKYLKISLPVFFALFTQINTSSAMKAVEATVGNFREFAAIAFAHTQSNPQSVTLCCVDLDDTTLVYTGYIGTEAWFSQVYDGLKQRGIPDPMPPMFFAAITAHQMNIDTVQPTEASVAGIYSIIQSSLNIPIIGLTSRTYILSGITKKQLTRLGIRFNTPWKDQMFLNADPTWRAMYQPEDGVVYCSGKNKGEILINLLEKTNLKFSSCSKPIDTIIVIDNDPKHLTRIKEAVSQKKIPVNLILVTYKTPIIAPVQPLQIDILQSQLDFILGIFRISQEETKRALLHNLYSEARPCCARTSTRSVSCPLEDNSYDDQ